MDFCEYQVKAAQLGSCLKNNKIKPKKPRVGVGRGKRRNPREGSEPAKRGERDAWKRRA